MKAADGYVRETMYFIFKRLSSKPLTRAEFGLGCFMEGTLIQIDAQGNTVPVEQLKNGDFVFHPLWERQVRIKTVIYGDESGVMYKIHSNDSKSVVVTETHPMVLCDAVNGVVIACGHNIAAKNVATGNWTQSVNGYGVIECCGDGNTSDGIVRCGEW